MLVLLAHFVGQNMLVLFLHHCVIVAYSVARAPAAPDIYCPGCSNNARCFSTTETSSNSHDITIMDHHNTTECRCNHITCEGVAIQPLCGSDKSNYHGVCQMRLESCMQQKDIHRLYAGTCRSESE